MATSQVGQQSFVIPAPTVKILHNSAFGKDPVKIEYMDSSNTTVGTYNLSRYPVVTAQDITPTMKIISKVQDIKDLEYGDQYVIMPDGVDYQSPETLIESAKEIERLQSLIEKKFEKANQDVANRN